MNIYSLICILIIFSYLLILLFSAPKDLNPFLKHNISTLIIILISITLVYYERLIGFILFIAVILVILCKRKNIEHFDIVEDDVDKIVEFEDDSLLGKLQNDEDYVTGVWSSSTLGKEMGLNRA